MNWKEQFDKELAKFQKGDDAVAFTKNFIQTEIIEKLIEEIPDKMFLDAGRGTDVHVNTETLKQQLRDKWLGEKTVLHHFNKSEAHRNFSNIPPGNGPLMN